MGQTAEGIKVFRETMIEKYGSEEAWRAHMAENALLAQKSWALNGRKPRGFAANRERARQAGAKGGRLSRRSKSKEQ